MKENDKKLIVAYFASGMFAEQTAVSIASLFDNNKDFEAINVYVVERNMTDRDKDGILKLSETYRRNIDFIAMPEPSEYFQDDRFTYQTLGNTYARMIIADLLPESVHKALCLESDILIDDSLMDLWNIDLSEYYFAGVENGVGDKVMTRLLNVKPGSLYCNGGVFLENLDKVREDHIEAKFKEYINKAFAEERSLNAYEEEVINKCCAGKILKLPYKYNVMSINFVMNYKEFKRFRGCTSFYSEEEVEEAKKHPVILHNANMFYIKKRIWEKDSDAPYTELYLKYRQLTEWKDEPQIEQKRSVKNSIKKEIWHMMPRKVAFGAAAYVRNDIRPMMTKKRDDE